jgi:hypothetical protein
MFAAIASMHEFSHRRKSVSRRPVKMLVARKRDARFSPPHPQGGCSATMAGTSRDWHHNRHAMGMFSAWNSQVPHLCINANTLGGNVVVSRHARHLGHVQLQGRSNRRAPYHWMEWCQPGTCAESDGLICPQVFAWSSNAWRFPRQGQPPEPARAFTSFSWNTYSSATAAAVIPLTCGRITMASCKSG